MGDFDSSVDNKMRELFGLYKLRAWLLTIKWEIMGTVLSWYNQCFNISPLRDTTSLFKTKQQFELFLFYSFSSSWGF
jgi:hypothetical protein